MSVSGALGGASPHPVATAQLLHHDRPTSQESDPFMCGYATADSVPQNPSLAPRQHWGELRHQQGNPILHGAEEGRPVWATGFGGDVEQTCCRVSQPQSQREVSPSLVPLFASACASQAARSAGKPAIPDSH